MANFFFPRQGEDAVEAVQGQHEALAHVEAPSAVHGAAEVRAPPPRHPPPLSAMQDRHVVGTRQPVISAAPQPAVEVEDIPSAPMGEASRPPPPSAPPPNPIAKPSMQPPAGGRVGIVRQAAGHRWVDPSLSEWPENDFRVFVGNLGPEVTDTMLVQAFSQYSTVQKARVVRDNKANKSKGFGFVSFSDAREGAAALREVHGRYIGNRPCQLKRSKDDRTVTDRKGRAKKRILDARAPDAAKHQRFESTAAGPGSRPAGGGFLHK